MQYISYLLLPYPTRLIRYRSPLITISCSAYLGSEWEVSSSLSIRDVVDKGRTASADECWQAQHSHSSLRINRSIEDTNKTQVLLGLPGVAVLPILSQSALSHRVADLPSSFVRLLDVGGYSSSDSFIRSCELCCKTLVN